MNKFHLYSASIMLFLFLWSSENMDTINTFEMNIPSGPETIPIAVAVDLSLSPNQLLANLETGFFRNA